MSTHNHFTDDFEQWWDPNGPFWTLHAINPIRIAYIHQFVRSGHLLDVGCGGGILTEGLSDFETLGIDTDPNLIQIAKARSQREYQCIDLQTLEQKAFDVITCLEVLEHVKDPKHMIMSISDRIKPDGFVFLSTLNRNPISFFGAIVAAEHILNMIPKHTHHYEDFITPSELITMAQEAQLELIDMKGIGYNPFNKTFFLTQNTLINYIACFRRK